MKFLIAASVAISLLLVGGCSTNWFNNEEEQGPTPSCTGPIYSEPFPTTPSDSLALSGRPIDTPEGWGWMVFYFEVLGLASNGQFMDNRFCLPVDVHIFGRTSEVDLVMLDSAGLPVQLQAFAATTPWFGRFAIQYDPTDPRFAGRPPNYEIHLDVAYAVERDIQLSQDPAFPPGSKASGIGCRIATDISQGWDSPATQPVAQDVGIFPIKTVASCTFYSSHFNYHG